MATNRPERKKSSLGGMSPMKRGPIAGEATPASAAGRGVGKQQAAGDRPGGESRDDEERVGAAKYPKVTFYQPQSHTARARAAYIHTLGKTGVRNFSAFVDAAVMAYVEELEDRYNGGEPFSEPKGRLPAARG